MLAVAVVAGFLVGAVTGVSDAAVAAPTASLGADGVLNVSKEDGPSERRSRF